MGPLVNLQWEIMYHVAGAEFEKLLQNALVYAWASVMRTFHPESWILGDGVWGDVP